MLFNPGANLWLRRLALPERALWILINAGGAA